MFSINPKQCCENFEQPYKAICKCFHQPGLLLAGECNPKVAGALISPVAECSRMVRRSVLSKNSVIDIDMVEFTVHVQRFKINNAATPVKVVIYGQRTKGALS